jgi:hypothetical protein
MQQNFNEWLDLMYEHLNFLVSWPERETVKHNMPESFKRKYPNCRVIILFIRDTT